MHICIQEWKYQPFKFTYLWMYKYVHAQILLPLQKPSQWWEMKVSPLTPTVQSSCVHCGYADHLFFKRKIKGTLTFSGLKIIGRLPKDYHSKCYPPPSSFLFQKKIYRYLQYNLKIFFLCIIRKHLDIVTAGNSYPDKL